MEAGRPLASLVLQCNRRHRQHNVVGEQGNQAVHVASLVGPGQPGDELLLAGRTRRRGRFPLRW